MNRRYPVILALIACSFLTSASLFAQEGFSAGAKVIGNLNKFNATSVGIGYGAGGFATMPIFGPLSARGELSFVSYSGSLDDASRTFEDSNIQSALYENRSLRFYALEIPLMAVVNIPFLSNLSPKFAAGYVYTYHFGAYQISDNTYSVVDAGGIARNYSYTNTTENVSSEFEPYNSSILGSLSVNFERIHVDLRYQHGIPNLSQNSEVESSRYRGDYKSRTLSISVGYRLL